MKAPMTTFPSDDELENVERRERLALWLRVRLRRLAVLLAASAFLYVVVSWAAMHMGERKYDAWGECCGGYLRERKKGN